MYYNAAIVSTEQYDFFIFILENVIFIISVWQYLKILNNKRNVRNISQGNTWFYGFGETGVPS